MIHRFRLKDHIKSPVACAVICLFSAVVVAPVAIAQEKPETAATSSEPNHHRKHTGGTHSKHEEEKFPEFEALASGDFRNVNLVVPIFRGLSLESHYFGVRFKPESEEADEHEVKRRSGIVDVGMIAGSWGFRIGEHIVLTPGFGVYFGEGQRTSPAVVFRWEIDKGRLFSQGTFVASLLESEHAGRANIWDGNHVSMRFWRLEVGPSWERIHTRNENEWKGGGRAAFRVLPNLSIIFFVLAPRTEYRGGILIHPER
jgi:hypothetical protein